MFIKKILSKLRRYLFPSEYELMLKKWWNDGGDYALRFNYDLNEHSIVIDLGGYEGQWASDLFSRYRCEIYIFEPVDAFYENISKRFECNQSIKTYKYGLGGKNCVEKIYIAAEGSSVYKGEGNSESIKIVDTKEWIDGNLAKNCTIDLMKINIEGGEYDLLERLIETNMISRIKNIQVQFHDVGSDSLSRMLAIQTSLLKTHSNIFNYKFVWESYELLPTNKTIG
jgi:FkbM family methyltransferase